MNKKADKWFVVIWIFVTTLGWYIAQSASSTVTRLAYPWAIPESLPTSPVYWATFGLVLGGFQWAVLRTRMSRAFAWVIVTAIGTFLAQNLVKLIALPEFGKNIFQDFPIFPSLVGGTVLGLTQFLLIRSKFARAQWWILTVALSWTIAGEILRSQNAQMQLLGILFFATCTGIMFSRLSKPATIAIQAA